MANIDIKLTKVDELTLKQNRWLRKYLEYGSARKAALEVYDCTEDSAGVIGFENLKKLNIVELMEEMGLTDPILHNKLAEGLEANKQLAARAIFKKDAPTGQSAHELPVATSMTDDFIEVPDFAVRHKYLETAFKLKGRLLKDTGVNIDGNNIQVNIVSGGYVPKSGRTNGSSEGSAV